MVPRAKSTTRQLRFKGQHTDKILILKISKIYLNFNNKYKLSWLGVTFLIFVGVAVLGALG